MWSLLLLLAFTTPWSGAQKEKNRLPSDNGHGLEVKLAVPGKPGNDYPILHTIPRTSFSCLGKEPGYYADIEANCQVFHVCTFGSSFGYQSFLCPNGTLFNQAVYVCDWWMNVNCAKSKELYNYKNELGSGWIGPHFMRDIKKMITHPMRNPYDQIFAKNNIITQDYKPSNRQLYNSISENYSQTNSKKNVSQAKETQLNTFKNLLGPTDISFVPSTPITNYYSNFHIYPTTNKNIEFLQQQPRKYVSQSNIVSKPRILQTQLNGQTLLTTPKIVFSYTKHLQNSINTRPTQINQKILKNEQHIQKHQSNNKKQLTKTKLNTLGVNNLKLQLNQHIAQDKELYSYNNNQARFSKDTSNQVEKDTKENLVSNDTLPTLIRKTLAFREIIKDPKNGTPKSKITLKTWIIRPPKSGKLLADPTPYIYDIPQNTFDDTGLNALTYINDTTKESIAQINTSFEPYEYNTPNIPSTQSFTTTTESPFTLPSSLPSSEPTKPSLLYLPPTTSKPTPIIYNIPTDNIKSLPQYLLPNVIKSSLTATGNSPEPFMKSATKTNDKLTTFSSNKQWLLKSNQNKLDFTDTLTKNNLDITVNDILKDTNNLLQRVSPNHVYRFKQEIQTIDYPEDNYLQHSTENQSKEKISLQPPRNLSKISKLIATPSIVLQPPIESYEYSNKNANRSSYLSFIKEPILPTIERTVSFKITIPQKIADFIFKRNISDNLEVLKTENTNNFVVANKMTNKKESHYVPIGKLTWNHSSNISPSQDLVFSFLADTINAAQKYSNSAQQNIAQPTHAQSKFQGNKNKEFGPISNTILQKTSAHISNIKALGSGQPANTANRGSSNNDLSNKIYTKNPQLQLTRPGFNYAQASTIKEIGNPGKILLLNPELIYSGQLYQFPVPEVTKQFYNSPAQASVKHSSTNEWTKKYQKQIYGHEKKHKQLQTEFEIIESQTLSPESYQITSNKNQQSIDRGTTVNTFLNNVQPSNDTITAQIHDNTIGTIPDPLNEDKLIKYKKNQIYYIYTHLNSNNTSDNQNNFLAQPNIRHSNLIYELIPSIGYKLENDNEKQTASNRPQNGQIVNPQRFVITTHSNQQQDISPEVINNPESINTPINVLYSEPSSYNAPQAIGSLKLNKNIQTDFNDDIEKVDDYEGNGYPKVTPLKRFSF